jgi:hypothetical protein
LVKTGAEGDGPSTDVMEINKPDDLRDIADLGLSLAEAKQLLANLQQEIVSRGLDPPLPNHGARPLTPVTGIRIPYGTPIFSNGYRFARRGVTACVRYMSYRAL